MICTQGDPKVCSSIVVDQEGSHRRGWYRQYRSVPAAPAGRPRLEWSGLGFGKEAFDSLQAVDRAEWRQEVLGHAELFMDLHDHLPPDMIYERELLICRL